MEASCVGNSVHSLRRQAVDAICVICGGHPWRQFVEAFCGGTLWRQSVEVICGGNLWRSETSELRALTGT